MRGKSRARAPRFMIQYLVLLETLKAKTKAVHTRGKFKFSDYYSPGDLNLRQARSNEQFTPWGRPRVTIDSTKLTMLGEGYAKVLLVRDRTAGLIICHDCKELL